MAGDGPTRSFYQNQAFDTYDSPPRAPRKNLMPCCQPFWRRDLSLQSERQAACWSSSRRGGQGLGSQLSATEPGACVTMRLCPATARICCQMPFVEISMPVRSMRRGRSRALRRRIHARARHRPGRLVPWTHLSAPGAVLTRTPVCGALFHTGLTRPANAYYVHGAPVSFARILYAERPAARRFAATRLISPIAQDFAVFALSDRFEPWVINGRQAPRARPFACRPGEPGPHSVQARQSS